MWSCCCVLNIGLFLNMSRFSFICSCILFLSMSCLIRFLIVINIFQFSNFNLIILLIVDFLLQNLQLLLLCFWRTLEFSFEFWHYLFNPLFNLWLINSCRNNSWHSWFLRSMFSKNIWHFLSFWNQLWDFNCETSTLIFSFLCYWNLWFLLLINFFCIVC